MTRNVRRAGAAILSILVVFALSAPPASAHESAESYAFLDVTQSSLSGRVDLPFSTLSEAFGYAFDGSDADQIAELEGRADELVDYLGRHFSVAPAGGQPYPLEFGEFDYLIEPLDSGGEARFVIIPFVADVGGETVPRELDVELSTFDGISGLENHNRLVLVQNDWQAGVFDNGEGQITDAVFNFGGADNAKSIDLGDTSGWKNFLASVELGLDHIRTGPDHILFIVVLLLPSVLVFTTGWRPSDNFGRSLWRVLKIATMFTVAHSITFTLAGLGVLPLPSPKFTETVIALSIAAAALHNLKPVFPNKEWVIAFAFGLFHGMGFASLVSGLQVDQRTQLISLLGRNVGIEIGQVLVILFSFGLLYLLRNTVLYRWVMVLGSLALAAISIAWMIERVFEVDLGTNTLVERFVRFPRVLIFVAVATALAAVYQAIERRRDRLVSSVNLPLVDADTESRDLVELG